MNRARGVRVFGKHAVYLDAHLTDLARTPLEEQAGEARSIEARLRLEDEVISRLDFDLAVTLRAGRRGHPAVRLARAEREGICEGRCGGQDERYCQDRK